MTKMKTGGHPDMKMVNPGAAAIDIGSTMHMAAVSPDVSEVPVRVKLCRTVTPRRPDLIC
jgi:hypothetical protein